MGGGGGGGITHGARAVCDGAVSQCVIVSPLIWGGGGGGRDHAWCASCL